MRPPDPKLLAELNALNHAIIDYAPQPNAAPWPTDAIQRVLTLYGDYDVINHMGGLALSAMRQFAAVADQTVHEVVAECVDLFADVADADAAPFAAAAWPRARDVVLTLADGQHREPAAPEGGAISGADLVGALGLLNFIALVSAAAER